MKCPICGGKLKGDYPFKDRYFNCLDCGQRFFKEDDGEIVDVFRRKSRGSSRRCEMCQREMKGGTYTAPWENGNNPDAYIKCPNCGHVNFINVD